MTTGHADATPPGGRDEDWARSAGHLSRPERMRRITAANILLDGRDSISDGHYAVLAATLAPASGDTAGSMQAATARAARMARRAAAGEGPDAVTGAITRYGKGDRELSHDQAARITVALRDPRVRDDAWCQMDPALRQDHLQLWTDLTQLAQPGYVAAPASLLAFTAWQCGKGALANVALDRALDDNPQYRMAHLLRIAIDSGAPPSLARPPMTPEELADG